MANTKGPQPGQKRMSFANLGTTRGGLDLQGAAINTALVVAQGTFVVDGANSVVVPNTAVTANSMIIISILTPGGTPAGAAPQAIAKSPGVGFTAKGTALDTSTYLYVIIG